MRVGWSRDTHRMHIGMGQDFFIIRCGLNIGKIFLDGFKPVFVKVSRDNGAGVLQAGEIPDMVWPPMAATDDSYVNRHFSSNFLILITWLNLIDIILMIANLRKLKIKVLNSSRLYIY